MLGGVENREKIIRQFISRFGMMGREVLVFYDRDNMLSDVFLSELKQRHVKICKLSTNIYNIGNLLKKHSYLKAIWMGVKRARNAVIFRLIKYGAVCKTVVHEDEIENLKKKKKIVVETEYYIQGSRLENVAKHADILIVNRGHSAGTGIYSDLRYFLKYFRWARDNGKKIVVDMQNYANPYSENGENGWEYFYEQPDGISMAQVSGLKTFQITCMDLEDYENGWNTAYLVKEGNKDKIHECNMVLKRYVRLNQEMKKIVEEEWGKIKKNTEVSKILGVKWRGTDYRPENIVSGHYKQAGINELIEECHKYIGKGYEFIFLAVDEDEPMQMFIREFGKEKVLYHKCGLFSDYSLDMGTAAEAAKKMFGGKKAGRDYICTIELLSRCDAFVGSINSGSVMAVIMNDNQYDFVDILYRGNTDE